MFAIVFFFYEIFWICTRPAEILEFFLAHLFTHWRHKIPHVLDKRDMDVDECSICTDAMGSDDSVRLPGCGHRFHTHCVMNFCRYNTHCPICRRLPNGVQTHETSTALFPVRFSLEHVVHEVDNVVDEYRRAWQRYRNRRRRALNNHPHLKTLFDDLQLIRRDIGNAYNNTQRVYNRSCRDVWRTDPKILEMRRDLKRLQRRERRMEQSLYNQLRALVGSEP